MKIVASFAGGTIGQVPTVVTDMYWAWKSFACVTVR